MGDFDGVGEIEVQEALADEGVLKVGGGLDGFGAGVGGAEAVREVGGEAVEGEVAVLVDGGGEDGAAVDAVEFGEVGAAAKKGDAEGGAGDDHGRTTFPDWTSATKARTVGAVASIAVILALRF